MGRRTFLSRTLADGILSTWLQESFSCYFPSCLLLITIGTPFSIAPKEPPRELVPNGSDLAIRFRGERVFLAHDSCLNEDMIVS